MRDVERIQKFCYKLAALWAEEVPDWRFGQLIRNFLRDYKYDIFYLEEDEFMKALEDYIERVKYNDALDWVNAAMEDEEVML